jgi:HK97 family phage prohead protease
MATKAKTRTPPRVPMVNGREVRNFATTLEARDLGGMQFRLDGYGSVTDIKYGMGAYDEVMVGGAFRRTLARQPDVQLLVNHEGLPLARTTIPAGQPGHLRLQEDSHGLHFDAQLDRNDPDAQTVMSKVSSGLLDQCSFAFRCVDQEWNDDYTLRTIREVDLNRGDVSVCNYGASPTTSVIARSRRGYGNPSQTVNLVLRERASRVAQSPAQQDMLVRTVRGRLQRGQPVGPLASALGLSKRQVRWLTELERQR